MQQRFAKNSMDLAFALCISRWGQEGGGDRNTCCFYSSLFLATAFTCLPLRVLLSKTGMHPNFFSAAHSLTTSEMHTQVVYF